MNKRQHKKQLKKHNKQSFEAFALKRKKEIEFIERLRTAPADKQYAMVELMKAFANDNLPVKDAEFFVNLKIEEYHSKCLEFSL